MTNSTIARGIRLFLWEKISERFYPRGLDKLPQVCKDVCVTEQRTKITISTDDLLSVPQAAKQLGVHFATVYRWIDKGRIRPFRIGGQVFVTVDDIRVMKEQREAI